MNADEFLARWSTDASDVQRFDVSLIPSQSGFSPQRPLEDYRWRIICEVLVERWPAIHEQVESERFGERQPDTVLAELLDRLDEALQVDVAQRRQAAGGNPLVERATVVILAGAGFSKAFGLPTTAELRQVVREVCEDPEPAFRQQLENAFQYYPLRDYRKPEGPIRDVEHLMSVWPGWLSQLNQSGASGTENFHFHHRAFLENLCCHLFAMGRGVGESGLGMAFAKWLNSASAKYDLRFVTFNYDVVLELLCELAGLQYTYTVREPNPNVIPIRKLHGSLNWYEFPHELSTTGLPVTLLHQRAGSYVYGFPHSLPPPNYTTSLPSKVPLLIAPAAEKSYSELFLEMWSYAAQDLAAAKKVIVIGYSFPDLDAFARFHLKRLIREKDVWYIIPSAGDSDRIQQVLNEFDIPPDQYKDSYWEIGHIDEAFGTLD